MKTADIAEFFLLSLMLLAEPYAAKAAAPALIPIQGYLTDDNDASLAGVYKLSFTLFDAANAGTSLFTSTEIVTVTKGRFTVYLGDKQQLQLDKIHRANAVWLEISIIQSCGSDSSCTAPAALNKTLSPRLQLATSAYAASAAFCSNADSAQSVGGTSIAELQPKIADLSCGANRFINSVQGGLLVCADAAAAPISTGSAGSQGPKGDPGPPGPPGPAATSTSLAQGLSYCTWYSTACQQVTGEECHALCPSGAVAITGACDAANGVALNESFPIGVKSGQPQGPGPFTATVFDGWSCQTTSNMASDLNSASVLCCPQ